MSKSSLIGGMLLIVGTSIGGGMLALPVAMAKNGFFSSILFLTLCWGVMTLGALLILEVNLHLPPGSNLISMARLTLGWPGQALAWILYLFLLYTLLAAYISGGSDIVDALITSLGYSSSSHITAALFTFLFGSVVYHGIKAVDYVNRGFMLGKLCIYGLLIIIISPHIHLNNLQNGSLTIVSGSMMILVTSFGFASIVPSLRDYFQHDIKRLRWVIIFGSMIPLVCYIAWNAVIMGVIAREGQHGLIALSHTHHMTSELTHSLNIAIHNTYITAFFSFFASICMVTAFLGVAIGLFDFLADGLKLQKKGRQGNLVFIITFLPPLIIVTVQPGLYLHALSYAGTCCVLLLLLLPTLMAWQIRQINTSLPYFRVFGGNWLLGFIALTAVILLAISL